MTRIDPRYLGTGGMPYNSPEGRAHRGAHAILSTRVGHDKPDPTEVYVLATRLLEEAECDFPEDKDADGNLTHAECACPTRS